MIVIQGVEDFFLAKVINQAMRKDINSSWRSDRYSDRLKTIQGDYKCQLLSAKTMNIEPWVTAEQVAVHLGVVKDTVYRWREHKGLPAHKIGRLWKFQLSEVDEWVRAGGADEGQQGRVKGVAP